MIFNCLLIIFFNKKLHHVYNPIWRDLSKIIHVFLIFIFGFVFVNIIFEIRENVFLFYMRGAWSIMLLLNRYSLLRYSLL
ncbi:hypothetical protein GLOIN_2v1692564 [Rhizophagus irregularis DAOM 181602=DAOM 197198]|nr:hypothetical protein GLOIN_2v1692564 [Rhizophagus irregularis DAOM 181602=DAOM 197198]